MRRTFFLIGFLLIAVPLSAHTEPSAWEVVASCELQMEEELQEERNLYRDIQYASSQQSVLSTLSANTTDLTPYLTLNYHALSCRLRALCESVRLSHGHVGTGSVLTHRPVGCSRLFAARGRWWSDDRRDLTFKTDVIAECAYSETAEESEERILTFVPSTFQVGNRCDQLANQILAEERQMLRLVVAQDSAHRGTRKVVAVFQVVLKDIRNSFLEPLRGLADLFGSVIHPIPCIQTQCN